MKNVGSQLDSFLPSFPRSPAVNVRKVRIVPVSRHGNFLCTSVIPSALLDPKVQPHSQTSLSASSCLASSCRLDLFNLKIVLVTVFREIDSSIHIPKLTPILASKLKRLRYTYIRTSLYCRRYFASIPYASPTFMDIHDCSLYKNATKTSSFSHVSDAKPIAPSCVEIVLPISYINTSSFESVADSRLSTNMFAAELFHY